MKKEFVIPVLLAVVIGLGGWTLIQTNKLDSNMSAVQTQQLSHGQPLEDLKRNGERLDSQLDKTEDKLESKLDKVERKVDHMRVESLKALNDIKLELVKSSTKDEK